MTTVSFELLKREINRVLCKNGMDEGRAEECAQIFAESSLDGVYSHGLNRVPGFVDYIQKGLINVNGEPTLIDRTGPIERYDGNLGPGNLNAKRCMDRAIEIGKEHGIGIVTLKNTNHWMRGGAYGWQAADAGCIGICWTNSESCMPPWGSKEGKLGNNPLVMAVPSKNGHVVLDMAMSQFSNGKIEVTRLSNETLPVEGGYNKAGELSRIPEEIQETKRILPAGLWKGSGLSMLLDLLAASLSGGLSTVTVDEKKKDSTTSGHNISQVFIAMDPAKFSGADYTEQVVNETIQYIHEAELAEGSNGVYYPGERTILTRKKHLEEGIPVEESIWEKVLKM
ncbi:3-dehydro-L-gulonate 2-dehydrogenase [Evansella sp. AB-P1]|uniref:3-dehydro-L-gulonate 2-dehydrogenase n=1 Tax=Evansella sp. AB-P1 TaxID=3037653 RepID=UPI00241D9EE5|nr:3-dehydro-L-gulonate 2-dehydrogenase [Evansella sp. AB-P1]MDG5786181.1 3-dehydro-L-gulonate 2-dehydrogenase [Evansella sp. AB-P1]